MSAKVVKKKKYYGSLITVGVVGGISVLAYFLVKKHKIKIKEIVEEKDGDKIIGKTYLISLGFRSIVILSKPDETDEYVQKEPIFNYTFKTNTDDLDEDGIPKVSVNIKNKINKKEENIILDNAIQN